jgi:hypothetical protein
MNGFIVGLIFVTAPALWMMGPLARDRTTSDRPSQSQPRPEPLSAQESRIQGPRINGILYFDAPTPQSSGRILR